MNIRLQIVSALLLLGLFYYYYSYKGKIIQTRANYLYKCMIYVALANLLLDLLTVFELTYMNCFTLSFITLSHRLFFISIDAMAYLIFRYLVVIIYDKNVLQTKKQILSLLPLLLSITITLFTPIDFIVGKGYVYSAGPGAIAIFASVVIYVLMTLYYCIRYWKRIQSRKRNAVIQSSIILITCIVIQGLFPRLLVSAFGIMYLLWDLFFALENPVEYIDQDTKAMNNYAFQVELREMFLMKKSFSTITILFDDWNMMISNLGPQFGNQLIQKLNEFINKKDTGRVYLPISGCPTIITDRINAYCVAQMLVKELECMGGNVAGMCLNLKWHVCIADYPNHGETITDVASNINFFATHPFEDGLVKEGDNKEDPRIIMYNEEWAAIMKREGILEQMLRDAIINDGIEMYYQPIYSTVKKDFHSAEALVRLKDKETLGFVSPEEFIVLAEKKGIIIDLSMIILEKVCKFIKEGGLVDLGLSYIEVNLSAVHCMDTRLVSQLEALMKRYEIEPQFLNLEITETTALNVTRAVLSNLERLVEMGCGFSMDDYGTG